MRPRSRTLRLLLPLATVALAGCMPRMAPCVDPGPLPHHDLPRLEVRILSISPVPTTGIVDAKKAAARKGAADGLAAGTVGAVYYAAALGPLAPIGAAVGVALLPFYAAGGALGSAIGAPGKGKVAVVERALSESFNGGLEATVAQRFENEAASRPDVLMAVRTGLPPDATDASDPPRLQISVSAGLDRRHGNQVPFSWVFVASPMLRAPVSGDVLWTGTYRYVSPIRSLSDWAKDDARDLRADIARVRDGIVAAILDDVLAVRPLVAHCGTAKDDELARAVGLHAIEPHAFGPLRTVTPMSGPSPDFDDWTTVDTPTPLLRWAPLDVSGAGDVTYELRVARRGAVFEEVYRRDGLTAAQHVVSTPLTRGAYFWTVRARYRQEGREYLTEWGAVDPGSRTIGVVPNVLSFRFRVSTDELPPL